VWVCLCVSWLCIMFKTTSSSYRVELRCKYRHIHRTLPYIWWFSSQKYRMYTVCLYGSDQPYSFCRIELSRVCKVTYTVLANHNIQSRVIYTVLANPNLSFRVMYTVFWTTLTFHVEWYTQFLSFLTLHLEWCLQFWPTLTYHLEWYIQFRPTLTFHVEWYTQFWPTLTFQVEWFIIYTVLANPHLSRKVMYTVLANPKRDAQSSWLSKIFQSSRVPWPPAPLPLTT
jgi:hypothetical protein